MLLPRIKAYLMTCDGSTSLNKIRKKINFKSVDVDETRHSIKKTF